MRSCMLPRVHAEFVLASSYFLISPFSPVMSSFGRPHRSQFAAGHRCNIEGLSVGFRRLISRNTLHTIDPFRSTTLSLVCRMCKVLRYPMISYFLNFSVPLSSRLPSADSSPLIECILGASSRDNHAVLGIRTYLVRCAAQKRGMRVTRYESLGWPEVGDRHGFDFVRRDALSH